MKKPSIFVGTLYSNEAEFKESTLSINNQIDVDVKHEVISNLPEWKAHNLLWKTWEKLKNQFDLFVKIDADTILTRNTALKEVALLFRNPQITGVQILLHDYFTDDLIAGLNAFSPVVKFKPSKRKLYADHADYNHQTVLKGEHVSHLAPIGWHCKFPTNYQAFHFGFRRALKKQTGIIEKCAIAYQKYKDAARLFAIIGADSINCRNKNNFDYSDKMFHRLYQSFESKNLDDDEINSMINKFIK